MNAMAPAPPATPAARTGPARSLGVEGSPLARAILARFDELKGDRSHRAAELEAVARLYRPQRQGFTAGGDRKGDWNLHELFNSNTLIAAGNMTASLYSTICNQANDWLELTTYDRDLAEWHSSKAWLATVSRRALLSFNASVANFYDSAVTWTADTAVLGTGAIVSDLAAPGGRRRIVDTCVSPADFVMAQGADGFVDEFLCERWLTPVAAARFYGMENLPPRVQAKVTAATGSGGAGDATRIRFVQAIQLNDALTPGAFGAAGMPWISTHVCEEGQAVVRQGGMAEQPFAVTRWDVDGANPWGRGLGYQNLASGRKLQAMTRDNLRAGALAVQPPIGTTGPRALREGATLSPGAFLHGAISHTGQKLVQPIFTFNGLPVTQDMAQAAREEVENGWHAQLLTLVGRTGLGNLEVIERQEERLRLQAPYLGRMQSEGLALMVERRIGLLMRAGQLPPAPPELRGQPLDIRFTSVAALAQRSQEGMATIRLLRTVAETAAAQPDPQRAAEVWDTVNLDRTMGRISETVGAPADVLSSPEEIAALRQARAQAAQAAQAMAMAQAGAAAAKDAAGAAAMLEGPAA
jgi:hypothetical protein